MSDLKKNLMLYGLMFVTGLVAVSLSAFVFARSPKSAGPSMGRAASFAVLGGSTVTNSGATAITGDLGVSSPGVEDTGFPPGEMARGAHHIAYPAANQPQADAQRAIAVVHGQPCPGAR